MPPVRTAPVHPKGLKPWEALGTSAFQKPKPNVAASPRFLPVLGSGYTPLNRPLSHAIAKVSGQAPSHQRDADVQNKNPHQKWRGFLLKRKRVPGRNPDDRLSGFALAQRHAHAEQAHAQQGQRGRLGDSIKINRTGCSDRHMRAVDRNA